MCLTSSNQQNTQNHTSEFIKADEQNRWLNSNRLKQINGYKTLISYCDGEKANSALKIGKSMAALSKYLTIDQTELNKNLDETNPRDHSCNNEKESNSVIHPDTFYVRDEKQNFDRLREELSIMKCDIQYHLSLYRSYIKELSSYILYTNIMIVLFHLMIFAIIISHPNCLYLYLYTPLRYL